eukprot:253941-Chlamydomonas_euryale.AAC.1
MAPAHQESTCGRGGELWLELSLCAAHSTYCGCNTLRSARRHTHVSPLRPTPPTSPAPHPTPRLDQDADRIEPVPLPTHPTRLLSPPPHTHTLTRMSIASRPSHGARPVTKYSSTQPKFHMSLFCATSCREMRSGDRYAAEPPPPRG